MTAELRAFTLVETDAAGVQVANISAPAVTDLFMPSGNTCLAADGTQLVSGREIISGEQTIKCQPGAESLNCPRSGRDTTVAGDNLVIDLTASGSPCQLQVRLNGPLATDNRMLGERVVQTLNNFTMVETKTATGSSMVAVNGRTSISCLGGLQFVDTAPIAIEDVNACPASGQLKAHLCAAALTVYGPDQRSFQTQLRAENGQTYQVLGGGGCLQPTYDTRITSVVGSLGTTFAFTSILQGSCPSFAIGALAVASPQCGGEPIPPSDVVKFGLSTERVGFFPVGDGLLCLGDEAMSVSDGLPIGVAGSGLPAASVATSVGVGTCTGSAFAFGAATPTTQACFMGSPPTDGFLLTPGTAVAFAYRTSVADTVAVGAAGFCIDPSNNTVQTATVEVSSAPPPPVPRIFYTARGGAAFDFDGDGNIDETVQSCTDSSLILCH